MNLYGYQLTKLDEIFEIGSGEGHLAKYLCDRKLTLLGIVEPDIASIEAAKTRVASRGIAFINCSFSDPLVLNTIAAVPQPTLILQDVIEHIEAVEFSAAIGYLLQRGCRPRLIGRTPNLSSPFGHRNSFGDANHIHRFTRQSLRRYLEAAGFSEISIKDEPYRITGSVSLLRAIPYHLVLLSISTAFVAVYGSWEGLMAPNLVFEGKA